MEIKKTNNKTKSNSYTDLVELIYDRVTGSYGIVGICDKYLGNKKATPLELSKAKKGIVYFRHSTNEEFSVSIPDEAIPNIKTVGDLVAFIEKAKK